MSRYYEESSQVRAWRKRIEVIKAKREAERKAEEAGEEVVESPWPTAPSQHREEVAEVVRHQRFETPVIPSRQEARNEGVRLPQLASSLMAMNATPEIEGVEFPAEPDSVYKVAYELLPAFLSEYGDRYPVRPSFVLKIWLDALKDGANEYRLERHEDENGYIEGWQLQRLVFQIAESGEQFNKRTMKAIAARQFQADREESDRLAIEFSQRDPYSYVFYRSVNPTAGAIRPPSAWTTMAGYPELFPDDIQLGDETLLLINRAVQLRFESEEAICSVCARWIAGEMVQVVQWMRRENKPEIEPRFMLELAFRYSGAYVLRRNPHKNDVHGRKFGFKNHLDDSGKNGINVAGLAKTVEDDQKPVSAPLPAPQRPYWEALVEAAKEA